MSLPFPIFAMARVAILMSSLQYEDIQQAMLDKFASVMDE